jgi:hypothetical protein
MLTTANAPKTNNLKCLPKHAEARDYKFLFTHPITDERYLASAHTERIDRGAMELLAITDEKFRSRPSVLPVSIRKAIF